ncbi:right-handed parallel beta-helix repeat-containing protein [Pendulispora albinea]|uniref:DUF1565 domain-containing protein n=1 Tax=Pendulispora albinea TaxID=2741071 RepID=A0ABZ2LY98_9BACT
MTSRTFAALGTFAISAALAAFVAAGAGCGSSGATASTSPGGSRPGDPDGGPSDPGCDPGQRAECPIVTSPDGSDASPGTAARPVRTLKRALAMAKKGQTISLGDGAYDTANGERWPAKVGDGVILEATTAGKAILRGAPDVDGLVFEGAGAIRGITLGAFRTALSASAGTLHASNIRISGGGGVALGGSARAALSQITLDGILGAGVRLADQARLEMNHGTIRGTTDPPLDTDACANVGVRLGGSSTATVNDVTVTSLGSFGIVALDHAVATLSNSTLIRTPYPRACAKLVQIGVADHAALTVEGSSVSDETGIGAVVRDESGKLELRATKIVQSDIGIVSNGRLELQKSVVEECRTGGVHLGEKSYAIIAGSTIATSPGIRSAPDSTLLLRKSMVVSETGYSIRIENAHGDLGTAKEPGGNHIFGKEIGLVVDSKPSSTTLVQASGNSWRPKVQGSDVYGTYTAQLVEGPQITNDGNFSLSEGSAIQF